MRPDEDIRGYASVQQRETLMRLAEYDEIADHFFLTGGTALSVCYLHHRVSQDLDLFSVEDIDLSSVAFLLRAVWPETHTIVRATPQFVFALIHQVRVDFVLDPLSSREKRERLRWDRRGALMVDTIRNIASNKLCTLVSRTEPKDFIDFYALFTQMPDLKFEEVYADAQKKEALLDDPPTAAYQMEESLAFLRLHQELLPPLLRPLDLEAFIRFYEALIARVYRMFTV